MPTYLGTYLGKVFTLTLVFRLPFPVPCLRYQSAGSLIHTVGYGMFRVSSFELWKWHKLLFVKEYWRCYIMLTTTTQEIWRARWTCIPVCVCQSTRKYLLIPFSRSSRAPPGAAVRGFMFCLGFRPLVTVQFTGSVHSVGGWRPVLGTTKLSH